jgi:hypothetical protein
MHHRALKGLLAEYVGAVKKKMKAMNLILLYLLVTVWALSAIYT